MGNRFLISFPFHHQPLIAQMISRMVEYGREPVAVTDRNEVLLIENCRAIVCMDDARTELEHADILIEGPAIKAVGRNLREKMNLPATIPAIDGRGHVALPGFVNVHHLFFHVPSTT